MTATTPRFVSSPTISGGGGTSTSSGAIEVEKEAGENLVAGDPVKIVANKVYKADNTDPIIFGLVKTDVLLGVAATIVISGKLLLTGLSSVSLYFVDASGITTAAPASGYIHRIGTAISSTELFVNIEEPILLA